MKEKNPIDFIRFYSKHEPNVAKQVRSKEVEKNFSFKNIVICEHTRKKTVFF